MNSQCVLNKKLNQEITNDWQQEFPGLGVYASRWLLRRVGPMLMGVCLDRDSSGRVYKPISHVHCLVMPSPSVYLTLACQLKSERLGSPDHVEVARHKSTYRDAAERVIRQSRLPFEGDIQLDRLLEAYNAFLDTPSGRLQQANLYKDMMALLVWAGDLKSAKKLLDKGIVSQSDPEFARVDEMLRKVDAVGDLVESQVNQLMAGDLPVSMLIK